MTPVIIYDVQQGTPEWRILRLGIPTSSEFSKIITSKGERSKSREAYLEKLADEQLSGMVENTFESSAMKRGKLMEPESRETFEYQTGLTVDQVAFVYGDERKRFGCSPDGLIGDHAGFETKDAKSKIQYERLIKGTLPSEHYHQVQGSLYVCQRELWYFRSYCRGMRALTLEIRRDESFIKMLSREIEIFCDELEMIVDKRRNT